MDDKDGVLARLKDEKEEENLVKSIDDLKVGTVVYVEMDKNDGLVLNDGYPTRLKYVVVAGAKTNRKEVIAVLINSEADFSNAPDWKAEQYPLLQCNYPVFLVRDSWVDCTDPKVLTVRKLKAKKAKVSGRLTPDDLNAVMTKLKGSDFIDTHTKKVFGIDVFDASVSI